MGQAKRRKLSMSWIPSQPVEAFRVHNGKIGITIKVDTADPMSVMFDADKVPAMLAKIDRMPLRPAYYTMVEGLGHGFLKFKRGELSEEDLIGIGHGILYTAMYHPKIGQQMRNAVSRQLLEDGKAHISWTLSKAGLILSLGKQYLDLGEAGEKLLREASEPYAYLAPDPDIKPN